MPRPARGTDWRRQALDDNGVNRAACGSRRAALGCGELCARRLDPGRALDENDCRQRVTLRHPADPTPPRALFRRGYVEVSLVALRAKAEAGSHVPRTPGVAMPPTRFA